MLLKDLCETSLGRASLRMKLPRLKASTNRARRTLLEANLVQDSAYMPSFIHYVPNASFRSKALDPIYFIKGHRHYDDEEIASLLESSGFSVDRYAVNGRWLSALSFILFLMWKYLVRRPQPHWPRYDRACRRDAMRDGFLDLYLLASKNET